MNLARDQLCEEQVVCWNCEETVHESATQCPYCYVELHRHHLERPSAQKKLTPFANISAVATKQSSQAIEKLTFITSLFLLLTGSGLLFLATLIAFFSCEGEFVVHWSEANWPAYFGLGIALLAFGTIFTQRLSSDGRV